MKKIVQILNLCMWVILPLQAHTKNLNLDNVILGIALLFGVPLLVIGTIIYFIVKKKQDTALRLTILFIILGIFYFLYIGF